jgi:hypothetical protein
MEHPLKISFRRFLDGKGVPYVEKGGSFIFPDYNFEVVPVYITGKSKAVPSGEFEDVLYLYEDRWRYKREFFEQRILSRLGKFTSIFARKCRVLSGKECGEEIKDFLNKYHTYGYVKSAYKYALSYNGEIVAVATFSEPRPMLRSVENLFSYLSEEDKVSTDIVQFQSYEWLRYASMPDVRVEGGMGKLLNAFIDEAITHNLLSKNMSGLYHLDSNPSESDMNGCFIEPGKGLSHKPIEVMTYADTEWSNGDVYKKLGFTEVEGRAPIQFFIDKKTFERLSEHQMVRMYEEGRVINDNYYKILNKGSKKFLLQIQ